MIFALLALCIAFVFGLSYRSGEQRFISSLRMIDGLIRKQWAAASQDGLALTRRVPIH